MKVIKAKVYSVVNYALGSGESYGVAVLFFNAENALYKAVVKPKDGSAWTYDREHILVNEMSENGCLLTLTRDRQEVPFVNEETGEDDIKVYEEKSYDMVMTDYEQVKI